MALQLQVETLTRLSAIFRRAGEAGISSEQLENCINRVRTTRLQTNSERESESSLNGRCGRRFCFLFSTLIFTFLPLLFCTCILLHPISELLTHSPCFIAQPTILADLLPAFSDCKFCRGITHAPRLSNLSREDFIHNYAYTSKPLLVLGAASNWSGIKTFSYDFFKDMYLSTPGAIDSDASSGQFFSYSSTIRNLQELFSLSSEEATMAKTRWYIGWSTLEPSIGEKLREHFSEPYFIPPGLSHLELAWVFMGAPGPGASIHIDHVEYPSWQAQLLGTKVWTLTPPPECEHACHSFNVTLNRGDIIVVDTNRWYHQTHVLPGNISITIGAEYR